MANNFADAIRPSIVMTLGFTLLCGLAYPFAVTGVGQAVLPAQANGSLIVANGATVGSELIGQSFAKPGYFHGRLSAAGKDGYDASSSSGSNLSPASKDLHDRIAKDVATLHGEGVTNVPADLVTTSASGLDPDISVDGAEVQIARVAKARGIAPAQVQKLVDGLRRGAVLGFIGEPRVNVLALNRQLDAMSATTAK